MSLAMQRRVWQRMLMDPFQRHLHKVGLKGKWITAKQQHIEPKDMKTGHLKNALDLIRRWGTLEAQQWALTIPGQPPHSPHQFCMGIPIYRAMHIELQTRAMG